MKVLSFIIVVLSFNTALAAPGHTSTRNIEMWCGTPHAHKRSDFPYLAAIKNVESKKHPGRVLQMATVYKFGHVVLRDYVFKTNSQMGMVYSSPDDRFALTLPTQTSTNLTAGFKAVIHDKDGATLVSNGQFPCHRQSS